MILSFLLMNALATDILTKYRPTFDWADRWNERTVNVTLFYDNKATALGTVSGKG